MRTPHRLCLMFVWALSAAGLVGASLVLVLGASFFLASLSATKPF